MNKQYTALTYLNTKYVCTLISYLFLFYQAQLNTAITATTSACRPQCYGSAAHLTLRHFILHSHHMRIHFNFQVVKIILKCKIHEATEIMSYFNSMCNNCCASRRESFTHFQISLGHTCCCNMWH